jgi:heme O synthase-like polyprenyltransferase
MYSEKNDTRNRILIALVLTLAGVTAILFGGHYQPFGFGLLGVAVANFVYWCWLRWKSRSRRSRE